MRQGKCKQEDRLQLEIQMHKGHIVSLHLMVFKQAFKFA